MIEYQERSPTTTTSVLPAPLHIHRLDVEELRLGVLILEVCCGTLIVLELGVFELSELPLLRSVFGEKSFRAETFELLDLPFLRSVFGFQRSFFGAKS